MSAKHGWTLSGRALGVCLVLALVGTALFASVASAKKAPLTPTIGINLGDSVSYGYSQEKFEANFPAEPASAFEEGFANQLPKKFKKAEKEAGNELLGTNLSCPGELSDGLVGENPGLGGGGEGNGKPDSAPCGWHNTNGFPRHVEYGPVSQLEAAIGMVKAANEKTGPAVKYITLQIGSNDELAVVHACLTPSYREANGYANEFECILNEVTEAGHYYKGGAFKHIITNLGTVVQVLRTVGYAGPIGILGFYNPQAEILPGSDELQKGLNFQIEKVVSKTTEHAKVKVGESEVEVAGEEKFGPGVFFANPFPKTNPVKGGKAEEKAICKYTEECNAKDKERNYVKFLESKGFSHEEAEAAREAKKAEAEKFPEGDIHPTLKGHKLFTKILFEAISTGKNVNESFH